MVYLWLFGIACSIGWLLFIWWTALIVLAIKGLLFHRHEQPPTPALEDSEPPPDEVPTLRRGCLVTLIFFFWPMFLGAMINDWLGLRARL